MIVTKLTVQNLRVIEEITLKPGKTLNVICGGNGAGKTSVLESLYIAGRGRSFRHQEAGPFIRHSQKAALIVVNIKNPQTGLVHTLGLERSKNQRIIRLDGRNVDRRSALVDALPIQWIGPEAQEFLEKGPEIRRRFVDLGLFHVEHGYLKLISEYGRILNQRNAALKQGVKNLVTLWDNSLCKAANKVSACRVDYTNKLFSRVIQILEKWELDLQIELSYREGWPVKTLLKEELSRKLEGDLSRGHTSVGPHRADILIQNNHVKSAKKLSRGQQKMLVSAFHLAQLGIIKEKTGILSVFLFDDLPAELDKKNRELLLAEVRDIGNQVFVTTIDEGLITLSDSELMFHVEHGALLS